MEHDLANNYGTKFIYIHIYIYIYTYIHIYIHIYMCVIINNSGGKLISTSKKNATLKKRLKNSLKNMLT